MLSALKKFIPAMAIVGYLIPYTKKGFPQALEDLKAITFEKLQAKWQNLALAAAAGAGLYIVQKIKMPPFLKVILTMGLWFLIGYNVALAIDPPGSTSAVRLNSGTVFVAPKTLSQYAYGRR